MKTKCEQQAEIALNATEYRNLMEEMTAALKEARRFVGRYENSGDNWAFQLAEKLDKAITRAARAGGAA